ncbi:MAG: type II toxin-antitoxin system PemK/MazF family toxin [Cyanobacteria bacterium J06649_4]
MTSLSTNLETPKRGEIWLVALDPTVGSELNKTRPAIVISVDGLGKLPVKLIVPITEWKPYFAKNRWQVRLKPNATNGLSKVSTADALQMRGADLQRFVRKIGHVSDTNLRRIALIIASVVQADIKPKPILK